MLKPVIALLLLVCIFADPKKLLTLSTLDDITFDTPQLQPAPSSKQQLPFDVYISRMNNSLGFEARFAMGATLRAAGVKDIKLGAFFPYCGNIFNYYVDLTDWPNGKKHLTTMNIDFPKICVTDLGVSIPFTTLCTSIDSLYVMPKGISGRIRGDISIGVSTLQFTMANLTIYDFALGVIEPCSKYKESDACRRDSACGWCGSRQQCLTARPDRKSDLCKVCPSCQWFYSSSATSKAECLGKNSCGWCETSQTCLAGDELGPFDAKSTCRTIEPTPSWAFVTRDENKAEGALAGVFTMSGILVGLGIFGSGLLIGIAVVYVIVKRRGSGYQDV